MNRSEAREPQNQDDVAILEVAREVSRTLGASGVSYQRVRWAELDDSLTYDSRFLRGGIVGLNRLLRGKLSPEEWRPLLSSSLLFQKKSRLGRALFFGSAMALFGILVWFLFFHVFPLLPFLHFSGAGGGVAPTFIVIASFYVFFYLIAMIVAPYMKRLRLESDMIVTREMSAGTNLEQVLGKIAGLSIDKKRKSWGFPLQDATIAQRIRNLSVIQKGGP